MADNITGWEIIPYTRPPLLMLNEQSGFSGGSQDVNSRVIEGTMETGLEKSGAISLYPESVKLSDTPEMQEESPVTPAVEEQKTRKTRLRTTKLIGTSYVSFRYSKVLGDLSRNPLKMYEDESPPNHHEQEMSRFSIDERMLLIPGLLKGWKRETRERQNGLRDKFYTHPLCRRKFRSVISVVNFIKSRNNLNAQNFGNSEEELQIQATPHHYEASSSSYNGFQNKSESNKRIFPIVFANEDEKTKARYKRKIENFLAMAYQNLMNLRPSPPDGCTTRKCGQENQENGGKFHEKYTACIIHQEKTTVSVQKNVEPETPNPQQGGRMNGPEPPRMQQDGIRHSNVLAAAGVQAGTTLGGKEIFRQVSGGSGSSSYVDTPGSPFGFNPCLLGSF